MLATKSALTLGMHHSCFCHGLRAVFLRRWRTPSWDIAGEPTPTPPPCPASRRRVQCSCPVRWLDWQASGDEVGFAPVVQDFAVPMGWGRSLKPPSSPASCEAPLDPKYRALGHCPRLQRHPGGGPSLIGLEQNPCPDDHPEIEQLSLLPNQMLDVPAVPALGRTPVLFPDHTAHLPSILSRVRVAPLANFHIYHRNQV